MLKPKEIVQYAAHAALEKGAYSIKKTLVLSFLAGAYIAMGGLLSILAAYGFPGLTADNPALGKLLMGATFPLGLIMVAITGAELFTGNNAYFIPSIMEKEQAAKNMFKNWTLVWIGNFIGALFFAYFLVYLTHVIHYEPWLDGLKGLATMKTSNPFYVTFLKGMGANWMVCLAMWLGMSAKDTTGKILGIWWPVMTFVAIGYEHSIANMFFLPLAMMEGLVDITLVELFTKNLIPATLGNIVGGATFVGFMTWYGLVKLAKKEKE